jgi:hypothetical protein
MLRNEILARIRLADGYHVRTDGRILNQIRACVDVAPVAVASQDMTIH